MNKVLLLALVVALFAACSAPREALNPDEYVEVDNPFLTSSPGAPAKIWVKRSTTEGMVQRGTQVVKNGYEAAKDKLAAAPAEGSPAAVGGAQSPAQASPGAPSQAIFPAVATAAEGVRKKVVIMAAGAGSLPAALRDALQRNVVVVDVAEPSMAERPDEAARRLLAEKGAMLTIVVSAPAGVGAGKAVSASIYDGRGTGLIRSMTATVADLKTGDERAAAAATTLARQLTEFLALLPWYAQVAAVEGDRVVVNAGRESGITVGRKLTVYRGGKVIPGIGFDPGDKVGTLAVEGFIGSDGSYGSAKMPVRVSDVVGIE